MFKFNNLKIIQQTFMFPALEYLTFMHYQYESE